MLTGGVLIVGLEVYILLITLATSFLISGIIVDKIKNRTKFFNIILLVCAVGLFLSAIPNLIFYYVGLFLVLLTIPQLIILWFTILVHETNILNRGRITTYLLISGFSLGSISVIFIVFDFLYIFFGFLEIGVLIIIYRCSRKYKYIETQERLKSDKKYLKIIFEKHFFRYSSSFIILSFILGNLLAGYGFEVDFGIFALASFIYLIAAGCSLDNIGRKISIVLGIVVLSFFLISSGSFINASYIFGLPRTTVLSIHYGFSILPILLAIFTISGDFSTERGNLKFRGRINGLFMSLLLFGAIIGYVVNLLITDLYVRFPVLENFIPNFPDYLNAFILVILLAWMMAMKEFLVSKEKKWANFLKNIFVFNKSGVCLYNYSFEKKEFVKKNSEEAEFDEDLDEDLISGALSGIITIISEITHSKRQLRQIQKEEGTLLFTYGRYHIVSLIASVDLPVLFKKIDEFSREFEQKFIKELKNFQGNIQRFEPARFLIVKYFSQRFSDII
jgi:MFS family permease